ncbi:Acetyltransferase (GNAT) family protein [Jannaschia seosinensis]|uniref:Acetyltransferase (GNAT) family protein n=1 Tax=Jannaschia seosinensis TaxID=313367 RepID=A0A0M7BBH0_9RHOB|nr:GNAT family protein [Jannaschia seosinensis]CUH39162.1 Acetyltransferase (GNAT) family protein [Jannaschia seosinensis]
MSPERFPLHWSPPDALEGRFARLERLDPAHVEALHAANPTDESHWRYLPYGPFPDPQVYRLWAEGAAATDDPAFYAVRGAQGWSGVVALMRADREHGVIEIGNIAFSPGLQRRPAATEAIHLLLDHCFASGFRRVEWKCNAGNAASRQAAERLGFTYEGTFRQHMIVKGRNRDTAWFAIVDDDWPRLREAHQAWLAPDNFDAEGRQIRRLSEMGAN